MNRLLPVCIVVMLLITSCSAGDGAGTMPQSDNAAPGTASGSLTTCVGLWRVSIDSTTGRADIADLRSGNQMVNVIGFLEPPPYSGISIDFDTLQINPAAKYVGVDVIIKHPLQSPMFTGFDVRGVVFGPRIANADGLTIAMSPEYFTGVPFGYKDGLLGVPAGTAGYTGLAGYKYYCSGLGLNDDITTFFSNPSNLDMRGSFISATQLRRHYDMYWTNIDPPHPFLVFNYAVYANYSWPVGSAPYDVDDFDIQTANSAEAFCADVTETANTLWYYNGEGGGKITLDVEAWDWQGDINQVTIESGGVIAGTPGTYTGPGSTDKSYIYHFESVPGTPSAAGNIDVLITATDPKTFGQAWFANFLPTGNLMYNVPVYNCWIHTTTVAATAGPCEDMEAFATYDALTKSGDPWTYLQPEDAGLTCTRSDTDTNYIISSVLRYYPVTYATFGASLADSADPIIPDVHYTSPFWIVGDIACDSQNNIYMIKDGDPSTLWKTHFDGSSFTTPVQEAAFKGDIARITIDDEDNPIVLIKDTATEDYIICHKSGSDYGTLYVNDTIVNAGIRDFDYNPVQDHYVFVCSVVAIKMFVMDKSANIVFSDLDLFGTQPFTSIPSVYIDQDDPDCHIVVWGTIDGATSFARKIVRFAALDYSIPKVMNNLTPSSNGPSVVGGIFVPGTSYMFVPGYEQSLGRITVPSDW